MVRARWSLGLGLLFAGSCSSGSDGSTGGDPDAAADSSPEAALQEAGMDAPVDVSVGGDVGGEDAAEDAAADASNDASEGGGAPPNAYTLTGTAKGASADATEYVECSFTIYLQNVVYADAGGWHSDMAGEVFRTVYTGSAKYEFQALVGLDADFAPTATGVDVILNTQPDPSAKPFWQELEVLHGSETAPYTYGGGWTCAPLMIDEPGWKDMKTSLSGTWTLVPGL